jgi:hypothetical protein
MGKKFGNLKTGEENLKSGLSNIFPQNKINSPSAEAQKKETTFARATFLIDPQDLKYIKDFVKYKRKNGLTNYTQKETLGEALELLRKKYPDSIA